MSRIGKQPVTIPGGVKVSAKALPAEQGGGTQVQVDGKQGKLEFAFRSDVNIAVDGDQITVTRKDDETFSRAYHGTARSLLANMVQGASEGYRKTLEIIGVGYQAKLQGKKLVLAIGFCHPVEFEIPSGLKLETPNPTNIVIMGADKQQVGEFAARIRKVRPPEPYKGKGIRYTGELVVRKQGKAFGSGD